MKKIKFIIFLILIVILQSIALGIFSSIETTKLSVAIQAVDNYAVAATQVVDNYVAVTTQTELVNAWSNYDGNSNLHIVLKNDIVIDRTYVIQSNWKIYFSSEGNNMYSLISNRDTGSTVFYVYQNGYLELQNIVVNGNYASSNNSTSCICNYGTVSLKGAVVANSEGNGIFQGAGTLTLEKDYDSKIYNSTADGIGIVGGTVYINSGEIYDNKNGITLIGGNLEINYGTISNNIIYGINAMTNFTFNGGYLLDKIYLSDNVIIVMNDVTSLNLKLDQYNEGKRVIYSNNSGLIQAISDKLTIDEEGWKGIPNNQNYISLSKKKFSVGGNLENF